MEVYYVEPARTILEGKFVEGLLIGVGAGVTSSIILGGFHWIRQRLMRRNQVQHLKHCVTEAFSAYSPMPVCRVMLKAHRQ